MELLHPRRTASVHSEFVKLALRRAAPSARAALGLLLVFATLTKATYAQTRRAGGAARKPAPASNSTAGKAANVQDRPVDLTKLVPSSKSKALASAYFSGNLPAPAQMPEGTVEERAAALAASVARGDANSIASLRAAVLASGYGVREQGGAVRRAEGAGQGLAFEAWQLAATAKLYGDGYGVGLERLGAALGAAAPELMGAPFVELVVRDLREAAASENVNVRFWAQFVMEMGRNAEEPYDFMIDEDVSRARLDAVQLSFLLTRLAADLHLLEKKSQTASAKKRALRRAGGATFIAASFARASYDEGESPAAAPKFATTAQEAPAAQPCALDEVQSIILDYNATATTTAFGSLMGYLAGKGVRGAGKWANLAGKANVVLTILKFIASYAAINTEITLEGGMLTRTKTTQGGERRTLTAKLVMDTGKWQALNCIRPAMNAAGLDFSLPGSGAMSGVRVVWRLVNGGDTRGYWGRVWHTATNVNKILEGKMTDDDGGAIVYLDTAAGATRAEDKHHYNYTDDNGESKIPVVGLGQRKDLSKETLKSVYKPLGVKVDVQVKTMKIKDAKGAAGTLGDLAGNAIAALTGDLWGAGLGTAAETAYRSNWYSSKVHYFPVKDWAPCDGGWRGTVTVAQELRENQGGTKRDHLSGLSTVATSTRVYSYEAKLSVAPGPDDTLSGRAVAAISDRSYSFESSMFYENCGNSRRLFTNDGKWTRQVEGSGTDDDADVTVQETSPGLFRLSLGVGGFKGNYADRQQATYKNHCEDHCDHVPFDETTTGEESVDRFVVGLEDLKADPEDPNALRGSRTMDDGGFKVTVTWNLTRCGG